MGTSDRDNDRSGKRRFDVSLQGKQVLKDFDIVKEAGGAARAVVKEFKGIRITGSLNIELAADRGQTLLSGVEIEREGN